MSYKNDKYLIETLNELIKEKNKVIESQRRMIDQLSKAITTGRPPVCVSLSEVCLN